MLNIVAMEEKEMDELDGKHLEIDPRLETMFFWRNFTFYLREDGVRTRYLGSVVEKLDGSWEVR